MMFKSVKMSSGRRMNIFTVTALLLVTWHTRRVESCVGGRYGRYENWPSKSDWDELFSLLSGYFGKGGYGWHSTNSYTYKTVGDYWKGSSSPGSSGGGFGYAGTTGFYEDSPPSSPSSSLYSSGNGNEGESSNSIFDTNKMKKALSDYFNGHKKHHLSTIKGSYHESPSPYSSSPGYKDDHSPQLPAGPPYGPTHTDVSGWGGGYANAGPPFKWPPQTHSEYPYGPESPLPPSPPQYQPQYYRHHEQYHERPSPTLGYNRNSNHNSDNNFNRHKNLFQTDFEVLGGHKRKDGIKRRRPGWRNSPPSPLTSSQSSSQSQAQHTNQHQSGGGEYSSNSSPQVPAPAPLRSTRPFRRIPKRKKVYRKQRPPRAQDRRGFALRRNNNKLNTSFGGYKVDHSRLRF